MSANMSPASMSSGALTSMLQQGGGGGENWSGPFGGLDVGSGAFPSLTEGGVDVLNLNLQVVGLGSIFNVRKSGIGQFLFRGLEFSGFREGEEGMKSQAADVEGSVAAMEGEAGRLSITDSTGGGGDGGGGGGGGGGEGGTDSQGASRPYEFGMSFEASSLRSMGDMGNASRGDLGGLFPDSTPSMGMEREQGMGM